MSSQTFAKVSLILKVLDFKTRQISIVSLDGNTIPSFFVEQNINYEIQIEKFLNSNFQIFPIDSPGRNLSPCAFRGSGQSGGSRSCG